MIQHYVPQFLLRNFADPDKDQIWVFDKHEQRSFKTSVKNVAAEKGFYDLEIDGTKFSFEPALGSLETSAADLVRRIVTEQSLASLTDKDKVHMSLFAAAQMIRVKHQRSTMSVLNQGIKDLITSSGGDPKTVQGFCDLEGDVLRAFSIQFLKENTPQFAKHFAEKVWVLYKTSESAPFYISDNPITLHNTLNQNEFSGTLGIAVEGIEIHMPLSSTICLAFLCPTIQRYIETVQAKYGVNIPILSGFNSGLAEMNTENVLHLNSLQVAYSTRFVYSLSGNFDLVQSMLSQHPELRTGNMPVIS